MKKLLALLLASAFATSAFAAVDASGATANTPNAKAVAGPSNATKRVKRHGNKKHHHKANKKAASA